MGTSNPVLVNIDSDQLEVHMEAALRGVASTSICAGEMRMEVDASAIRQRMLIIYNRPCPSGSANPRTQSGS
jgi:hypothetical protein